MRIVSHAIYAARGLFDCILILTGCVVGNRSERSILVFTFVCYGYLISIIRRHWSIIYCLKNKFEAVFVLPVTTSQGLLNLNASLCVFANGNTVSLVLVRYNCCIVINHSFQVSVMIRICYVNNYRLAGVVVSPAAVFRSLVGLSYCEIVVSFLGKGKLAKRYCFGVVVDKRFLRNRGRKRIVCQTLDILSFTRVAIRIRSKRQSKVEVFRSRSCSFNVLRYLNRTGSFAFINGYRTRFVGVNDSRVIGVNLFSINLNHSGRVKLSIVVFVRYRHGDNRSRAGSISPTICIRCGILGHNEGVDTLSSEG